jgi:hypothetical protein
LWLESSLPGSNTREKAAILLAFSSEKSNEAACEDSVLYFISWWFQFIHANVSCSFFMGQMVAYACVGEALKSEQRNGPEIAFHLLTPSPNKLILKLSN